MKHADTVAPSSSSYDAGKKINGRKRPILTDTQGLLLGVMVTPASVQDRDAAKGRIWALLPAGIALRPKPHKSASTDAFETEHGQAEGVQQH